MPRLSHVAALSAAALITLSPVAYADGFYNNDGDVIGVVGGGGFAYIGNAPVNPPITVTANSGTIVPDTVIVYNDSIFNMTGGSVGFAVYALDSSVVNLSGGSVGGIVVARDHAVVNYSGGSVGIDLAASGSGVINFFGKNLSAAPVNPDYFGYSEYALSGLLSDGTNIAGTELFVDNNSAASFNIINAVAAVPEPGAVAFGVMAMGSVLGLVSRKRRK